MFNKDTVKDWNAHLMSHNAETTGLPFEERIVWVMEWTLMWYMMEKSYGK